VCSSDLKIENSFNKNLSVINAQSFLVDDKLKVVLGGKADTSNEAIQNKLLNGLNSATANNLGEKKTTINFGQSKYAALLIPAPANNINIKYIVIFTSLDQINTLQQVINLILLIILLITAFISILISSYISRRISKPLSSLNEHIRSLSERKFTSNVNITAENEIQELVDNVNTMSEKLEMYDHA
jgi:methyl-accepting chemotaxis protein